MCEQCETHDRRRRAFLTRLLGAAAFVTVGGLESLVGQKPRALGDSRIVTSDVSFSNAADQIFGFLARPKKATKSRGVIIMHGNPGITEDVQNTAAQLAVAGFAALAIDWASRKQQDWRKIDAEVFGRQQESDAAVGVDFLLRQSFVRGSTVGFVGFCGGGRLAFMLAADSDKVGAIVSFYGPVRTRGGSSFPGGKLPTPDPLTLASKIRVPVQGHYGERDEVAQPADAREFEQALRAQHVTIEMFYYPSAGHRFYNHLNPPGSDPGFDYVPQAAVEAHKRMVRFLKKNLP